MIKRFLCYTLWCLFITAVENLDANNLSLSQEANKAPKSLTIYTYSQQTKWKTWFGEDFNDKLILNNPLGLFTDDLEDLVITLDKTDDLIKVRKWIGNVSDGKVYIAVHGEGDLFKITHNGQEYELSHRSVARWITENKNIAPNAEIVLLSCANERAAQNLSNALKGNYKVTSWNNEVTVFANGHIQGSGKCYAYQPSSTSGYNRTEIASANAPYGSNRSNAPPNTEFVVLGRKFGLYAKLDADHKATYDALVKAGLKAQKDGNLVRFVDVDGLEVLSMAENKVLVKKWGVEYESKGTKIQTATGYIILINGKSITVDIGFKEGRKLSAEEVNDYLINGQRKDPGEPYKKGTIVEEILLGTGVKDNIYFVEDFNGGKPKPGQYGSDEAVYTLLELRQKLAVKEAWKKTINEPTLRSYLVISPIRARSGIIGPQTDLGVGGTKLVGGGHQYEVIDFLDINWNKYLNPIGNGIGIKLAKVSPVFNKLFVNSINGFSDQIEFLLKKYPINNRVLTLEEFKKLIIRSTLDMTLAEKDFVNSIRNSIPYPNGNTILQKVISVESRESFFENTTGKPKTIGGYLTTAKDSKHLLTYMDIFEGMRLDYPGSEFVSKNATSCCVIRFKANNPEVLKIPKNFDNGGELNNPLIDDKYNKNEYPFTGHGFTSGKNGRLGVPEWKATYPAVLNLKNGAEMYIIDNTGFEKLIAVYDADLKIFLKLEK